VLSKIPIKVFKIQLYILAEKKYLKYYWKYKYYKSL